MIAIMYIRNEPKLKNQTLKNNRKYDEENGKLEQYPNIK